MVSDVVLDVATNVACQALAAKEDVIRPAAGGVGFSQNCAAGAIPVIARLSAG